MVKYDVCVVGSGAGGAPLAWSLAMRGLKVLLLEKGSDFDAKGSLKDELSLCTESPFIPKGISGLREVHYGDHRLFERHLWMGCTVGGGTRIMSGFFLPMNEKDFTPRSSFGSPQGATHEDWPIGLTDLQPYYDLVEKQVGISPSAVTGAKPLQAHGASEFLRSGCERLGIQTAQTPRAILTSEKGDRGSCSYSGLCGSYPCTTGAKGSTRDSYVADAVKTGNCTLLTGRDVIKLNYKSNAITSVEAIGPTGLERYNATTFVLALSAIETARLLLHSRSGGLANSSGQVGKNLTFTVPSEVTASFKRRTFPDPTMGKSPFVLRYTDFFRELPYPQLSYKHGGSVLFIFPHPNLINRAKALSYDDTGKRIIGSALKKRMEQWYKQVHITTDTFIDYLPWKGSSVSLSRKRDLFGRPIAKVHYTPHPSSQERASVVGFNLKEMFKTMGPENVHINPNLYTAGELQHGTCRFGDSPKYSVLNANCRTHDLKNCYVTDASFFPSGISVPSTFTIMANSLRVAETIFTS